MIDAGKIIYDGPISAIKDRFGKHRVINFETLQAASHLSLPAGAEVAGAEPGKLSVRFDRTRTTASQVAAALMSQVEVKDFSLSEPDLASIVKQIYGGALKDGMQ
jgi:ABC-2 type transport system ATP-binding protein